MSIIHILESICKTSNNTDTAISITVSSSQVKAEHEEICLDTFLVQYSTSYSFSSSVFMQLFRLLVLNRFNNRKWVKDAARSHFLRILQTIRVLSRDGDLLSLLVQLESLPFLKEYLMQVAEEYYSTDTFQFTSEVLVELCSTLKRIAAIPEYRPLLFHEGVHNTLVLLLSVRDPFVLHATLVALFNLSLSASLFVDAIGSLPVVEPLVQIMASEAPDHGNYKSFAAEILDQLSSSQSCCQEIVCTQGLPIILRQIHSDNEERLLVRSLQILCNIAKDRENSRKIMMAGGIPLILSLIESSIPDVVAVAVCSVITQLTLDDENAYRVRKAGGIHKIAKFLLTDDSKHDLHKRVLRVLRFLFSVERNRRYFKRLFPPAVFAAFIDVGHYITDISAYEQVSLLVEQMNDREKSALNSVLSSMQGDTDTTRRVIRGMVLREIIGKGAFGTVWQAHMEGSNEGFFAVKELPLAERFSRMSMNQKHITLAVSNMCKEVEILSDLRHPSIVRYFQSFVENDSLYIVMEFVEGASLLDRLNSLAEKKERFPESKIWQIFVQICLALCYLHFEKGVVHRDLTPGNIMLDRYGRVKITDFGLARQLDTDSVMSSVVGTISYSCPEIVQHKPYTEKADIWSLGCILYQMATLKAPFSGSNPLSVAQSIVQGKYLDLPDNSYSPLLRQVIGRMLTVNPLERPHIISVSQLISPLLMTELDRANNMVDKLEHSIRVEKDANQRLSKDLDLMRVVERNAPVRLDSPDTNPSSKPPFLSVSTKKLRPISDPCRAVLKQVHKLVFIAQQPPRLARDLRRSLIIQYERNLFSHGNDAILKEEMKKLSSGSPLQIELFEPSIYSEPPSTRSGLITPISRQPSPQLPMSSDGNPRNMIMSSELTHRLSYTELQIMIEQVLEEDGYYGERIQSGSSSSKTPVLITSVSRNPTSFPALRGVSSPNLPPRHNRRGSPSLDSPFSRGKISR